MTVDLLEVTKLTTPLRARQLHELVNQDDITPNPHNSGALERYNSKGDAFKNAIRLATAEGLKAYLVRERVNRRNKLLGIATVIDINVKYAPNGEPVLSMHDLDYWLKDSCSDDDHVVVGQKLVASAKKVAIGPLPKGNSGVHFNHGFMATVDPLYPEVNRGLNRQLDAIPGVDPLEYVYDIGDDPYGIGMDGQPLQILYKTMPLAY